MDIELDDDSGEELKPLLGGTGMLTLRDYQNEAVGKIFEEWLRVRGTLLVCATGTGKTVIMAEVALRWPSDWGRVLFLVHRDELADQAQSSVGFHIDDEVAVEMGERRERDTEIYGKGKVLVASVQTLSRESRRKWFKPAEFGLLLLDEAHHSVSDSWRGIIEWALSGNPKLRYMGATATPDRADQEELGQIFESVAYEMDILKGVDCGWLVMPRQKYVTIEGLDFSRCRTTAGDLNSKDLETAMYGSEVVDKPIDEMTDDERESLQLQEKMLHKVIVPTLQESQKRPCLMFCVTVAHAERSAEIASRYGYIDGKVVPLAEHPEADPVTAECLHGKTPKDIRKEMVNRFKGGHTMLLTAVGVPTEGFDAPECAVISVARPTKSRSLYVQMIGRSTRPVPKLVDQFATPEERKAAIAASRKPFSTILDFVGNSGRHSLISVADVLGGSTPDELLEAAKYRIRESEQAMDVLEAIQEEKDERERIKKERAEAERKTRDRYIEEQKQRREEAARRRGVAADVRYQTRDVDAHHPAPDVAMPTFRGGATDKQVGWLVKLGIKRDAAMTMTKPQAGAVINKQQNLEGGDFRIVFGKNSGKSLREAGSGFSWWVKNRMEDSELRSKLLRHISLMESPRNSDDFNGNDDAF